MPNVKFKRSLTVAAPQPTTWATVTDVHRVAGWVSVVGEVEEREHLAQSHDERCGHAIEPVGFYADVVADALSLPACEAEKRCSS